MVMIAGVERECCGLGACILNRRPLSIGGGLASIAAVRSVGLPAEKLSGLLIRPSRPVPSLVPNFTPRSLTAPCTPVPTVFATVATPLRLLSRNCRVLPSPFGAHADSHVMPLSAAANRVSRSRSKELTDADEPERVRLESGR